MYDDIKIWNFYMKDKNNPNKINDLYAFTDNKSIAKEFQDERNMDLFICTKEILSHEEFMKLSMDYSDCRLRVCTLPIYNKKTFNKYETDYAVTLAEHCSIFTHANIYMDLYNHCWINPLIFNDDLYNALTILQYTNIYQNIISQKSYPVENANINLKPDHLGIFIHLYGKTLKEYKKL